MKKVGTGFDIDSDPTIPVALIAFGRGDITTNPVMVAKPLHDQSARTYADCRLLNTKMG